MPVYRARENEPVEVLRARLQYQSRKRGMLENGLVLRYFIILYCVCVVITIVTVLYCKIYVVVSRGQTRNIVDGSLAAPDPKRRVW